MKKLALALFSVAALTTSAFACPHDEADSKEAAPKTAEKAKTQDKAKAAPAKEADQAKTTKTAKPTEKKPEKVSAK